MAVEGPASQERVPVAPAPRRAPPPPAPSPSRQPALHQLVTAVCAPVVALSGRDGQMRAGGAEGLYVHDVRVLSELRVTIAGEEPVPLGYDLATGCSNRFEAAAFNVAGGLPDPVLFVTRRRSLSPEGMTETLLVSSRSHEVLGCRVEVHLASDLTSVAAVKSGARSAAVPPAADGAALVWRLADGREIRARGEPKPASVDPGASTLAWELELAPSGEDRLAVVISQQGERGAVVVSARRQAGGLSGAPVGVEAGDPRLARLLERSLADLESLRAAVPAASEGDAFLAAGAPWYLTLFGRDSIWAARMTLPLGTDLALGTLRTLARLQGRTVDRTTGEEPGKILHELRPEPARHERFRAGPDASSLLVLPPLYYGTVDATPLWVCLLHDAWRWGLEEQHVEQLLDPMQRCLAWISDYGCQHDGFVSYVDHSGHGLANQGWKDSYDAIQYRDGRLGSAPLALCEVQAYAFEACMAGAELLDAFGRDGSDRWRALAGELAARFRSRFWVESRSGAYPAVALDADGARVDSLSSNIGHLLGTGLLDGDEEQLVVQQLGRPELDSGHGLRTLASCSAGFNPLGYHSGSVWAHDSAIVVTGLSRTGGTAAELAAASLVEGLLRAAEGFGYRMPELYGGHDRGEWSPPLAYPASCSPQAWSAAAAVALVAALLRIRVDVPRGELSLEPLRSDVALRRVWGLRIGASRVGLRLESGGGVTVEGCPEGLRLGGAAAPRGRAPQSSASTSPERRRPPAASR